MATIGCCRFENTFADLMDCYDHINDDDLNDLEIDYRIMLVDLCLKITRDFDRGHRERNMVDGDQNEKQN
jgi:hypothetical protein